MVFLSPRTVPSARTSRGGGEATSPRSVHSKAPKDAGPAVRRPVREPVVDVQPSAEKSNTNSSSLGMRNFMAVSFQEGEASPPTKMFHQFYFRSAASSRRRSSQAAMP